MSRPLRMSCSRPRQERITLGLSPACRNGSERRRGDTDCVSGESREPHPFAHLPIALQRRLGVLRHEPSADAEFLAHLVPAWLRETSAENRLPVTVAVLVAVALQFVLPRRFSLPPRELLPSLELLVLITLVAMNPVRLEVERRGLRALGITLIGAMTLANAFSAGLLADHLVNGTAGDKAGPLLLAGGSIYITNIIAFALWYWEFDRGGPFARRHGQDPHPDFLFPQMTMPEIAQHDWEPQFPDYLYVSFTNATAFSPTDTMPLSRWAKMLMAAQSSIALITVALVIARAVNVLK